MKLSLPRIGKKPVEKKEKRTHIKRRLKKIKTDARNEALTDDVEELVSGLAKGDG